LENIEIRKVEREHTDFVSKSGQKVVRDKVLLHCDDQDGERVFLRDYDFGNFEKYSRGQVGTFVVRIDVEEGWKAKTLISIVDFIPNAD
jgi:hypothetical protein